MQQPVIGGNPMTGQVSPLFDAQQAGWALHVASWQKESAPGSTATSVPGRQSAVLSTSRRTAFQCFEERDEFSGLEALDFSRLG
jgi:hypothetical protein